MYEWMQLLYLSVSYCSKTFLRAVSIIRTMDIKSDPPLCVISQHSHVDEAAKVQFLGPELRHDELAIARILRSSIIMPSWFLSMYIEFLVLALETLVYDREQCPSFRTTIATTSTYERFFASTSSLRCPLQVRMH